MLENEINNTRKSKIVLVNHFKLNQLKPYLPREVFGYVTNDMTIVKSISKMPASVTRAMEEDGPTLLLPRNSAIAISFFYCTVNHATERRN